MTNTQSQPTGEGSSERAVADLLDAVVRGRPGADSALLEVVYPELRAIAGSFFKAQSAAHTLQPTALVHEAYMKLLGGRAATFEGRAHFVAIAAKAMRQVLIDHARKRRAEKRGGDAQRLTLTGAMLEDAVSTHDALDVHETLEKLTGVDERQARVVEMRFFAGLSVQETAQVLGVSERTVEMDWRMARAWLRRELAGRGN